MHSGSASLVDQHLQRLDRALSGPRGLKRRMLAEARDGLDDAVADLRAAGQPATAAQRQAIAEFGGVDDVAPAFQAELAASAARVLGLRVIAVFGVSAFCSDLMWRGAPWSGPRPPEAYLLLSDSVDALARVAVAVAVLGSLALWLATRRGRTVPTHVLRGVMAGLVAVLTLLGSGALALFGWSAGMWTGALTWPPMIVGGGVMAIAATWIGRSAATGLDAARSR
ncbi:permease prefix domain 1-containing protein [Asanoa sp. NPDC049518]|uniref:permease prefix domain 1-containing protein n=1 Tax=unclassified Asanoa TaxID=2685164 RepID=UPI003444B3DC